MKLSPPLNALLAALYIALISSLMFYAPKVEDSALGVLAPMMVLSLFVLSAAVMGYLFLAKPLILYFDGKKEEGLSYFLKTLGVFALITIIFLGVVFSLVTR